MKNQNIEPFKVFINRRSVSLEEGWLYGYLVSVRARQNQALQFSVVLENGALYTGLPIHHIVLKKDCGFLELKDAQAYDCISDDIEVFTIESLRYMKVKANNLGEGKYLFSIDFVGEGHSRDPEQWKQFHIIALDSGQLVAIPQNYFRFLDDSLFEDHEMNLKRNTHHWIVG